MDVRLNRYCLVQASIMLGIFILITFLFFMIILVTISARCKQIKPRTLPDEDTNTVAHIEVDWFSSDAPAYQESPPSGAFQTLKSFTNELVFPWYPGLSGWLSVWRTESWQSYRQSYTLLHYVMFSNEDRFFTNSNGDAFVAVKFVDQYSLDKQAFYNGVIFTNSP